MVRASMYPHYQSGCGRRFLTLLPASFQLSLRTLNCTSTATTSKLQSFSEGPGLFCLLMLLMLLLCAFHTHPLLGVSTVGSPSNSEQALLVPPSPTAGCLTPYTMHSVPVQYPQQRSVSRALLHPSVPAFHPRPLLAYRRGALWHLPPFWSSALASA